jgi:hypothetical protein
MKKHTNPIALAAGCLIVFLIFLTSCKDKNASSINPENKLTDQEWKIIGPGAGGGVFIPTISPFDTNFVFSKGDMTGAFVTYDGGRNWKLFNLMSVVQDFEFDPSDPDVIYAASRGYLYDEDRGSGLTMLYKSENKGKSWRVIYPDIRKIGPLEKLQSQSFLPSELVKGMPDGSIDLIRVDPGNNRRIFLGLSPIRPYIGKIPENIPKITFLVGSENKGEAWNNIGEVPGTQVLGIFPSSLFGRKNEVTVITEEACMRINRKTGETKRLPLPEGRIIKAESGVNMGGTIIYIIVDVQQDDKGNFTGGVYSSIDGGETWKSSNGRLLTDVASGKSPRFLTIDVCKSHQEVAYLSVYTMASGPEINTQVRYEIYRTENSGVSWEAVYSANAVEVLSHNFNDSWLNNSYGPGWGGDVLTLGVSPTDPDICYATDYGQAYKTSDGGHIWNQVCSKNNPDGSVTSRGLDLTCCYGVVFDPFDMNHLIISYIDIGLFHSYDGGKSWYHDVEGIPDNWVNTCYSISFDPAVKGRVWSTWANKHSLTRKSQFGDGKFQSFQGGVAISNDGGRTWQKCNNGIPENSICTNLLIDPLSPENARTLYLTTFNQGIYKSTDGGKTWVNSGTGLRDNRYAWQIRKAGIRLFLVCVRGWHDEEIVDGVIYSSRDGAANWQQVQLPEGVNAPSDLQVDPGNPEHMVLCCWPIHKNGKDICGGVYITLNGGGSWRQCFDESIRVFAAAFDPRNSKIIYINTFQNGAYRSEDSGETWKRITGYRFKWGHCPVPDPNNPDKLFLTTYGVSVYYGPAKGTADEFGKIENIPESWW